jgi:hypothetical protein
MKQENKPEKQPSVEKPSQKSLKIKNW